VSSAPAIAVVVSAGFVGVLPPQPLVPLGYDVPLPIVSLLLRDEPVALLSLFAPLRSRTSWDRIRSSFLRVMGLIQSFLLG
jgi:hypothetical protein